MTRSSDWPALLGHIAKEDLKSNPRSVGPAVALGSMLALAWEAEVYAAHPDAIGAGFSARPAGYPDEPMRTQKELMDALLGITA